MRLALLVSVLLGSMLATLGCAPTSMEVAVRDPFAVSLRRVDGEQRALILPAEPAPAPPADKVARALWGSHQLGGYRAVVFGQTVASNAPSFIAERFGNGGLAVSTRGASAWGDLLGDDGVIHLFAPDLEHTRIEFDRVTCELVITLRHHRSSRRRGGVRALLDVELRTPLTNVLQIRNTRIPAWSDRPEVKVIYP